jgi:hypothetical protein
MYERKKRGILANRIAQGSFEYLAIFVIGLIIMVPMVYLFQRYSLQSATDLQYSRIAGIGRNIMSASESVYYMGYPARVTLQESFPPGIKNMSIKWYPSDGISVLDFNLYDGQVISFDSHIQLGTNITADSYGSGIKNIMLETRNTSTGNLVWIQFS